MGDDLKPGDRVRVLSFEGIVRSVGDVVLHIEHVGTGYLVQDVPMRIVEKLPEPVKVGDLVASVDALDSLPPGTVVVDSDGDAFQKHDDDWCPAVAYEEFEAVGNIAQWSPRVVYLPAD